MAKFVTLQATYRIVTPMFIGGANQTPDDGIRPPSVKSALRFWWRALNWGPVLTEAEGDDALALRCLHQREAVLFGAAVNERGGGQSRVFLQVTEQAHKRVEKAWPAADMVGSRYLAFGLLESGNRNEGNYQPAREALAENTEFELTLTFTPMATEADVESVKQALFAWSLFGGLGGRSRRALGSVTLTLLDGADCLQTADEYGNQADELLRQFSGVETPPFTTFSAKALFKILGHGNDPRNLHDRLGKTYKSYRNPENNGLAGEQKIPFGLPLKLKELDIKHRRASPLFFHVHALQDNNYVIAALLLPARFHYEVQYQTISYTDVANFLSVKLEQ